MQDQWEYKTLLQQRSFRTTLKDAEGTDYGPFDLRALDEFLNGFGKQGWEVCSLTVSPIAPVIILLKRRIAPA